MVSLFLSLLATTLFLVARQANGYYMAVFNDCAEGPIYISAAFINSAEEGICYENMYVEYEDGEFLVDRLENLVDTPLPIFFTYAESVSGAYLWSGDQLADDETVEAACGSDTPVKMIPWTVPITTEELAELGINLDQDLLVAFHSCDNVRRTLRRSLKDNQEDCIGTLTHNSEAGCVPGELPDSKKDFILHHLRMVPPDCGDKDSCTKKLKELHRYRRFLKEMQK